MHSGGRRRKQKENLERNMEQDASADNVSPT